MQSQQYFYFSKPLASVMNIALMPVLALTFLILPTKLCATANARDLMVLADILAPAYIAMNFASACAQDDRQFLSRTRGVRGSVVEFTKHVREETIFSLKVDEATTVMMAVAKSAMAATNEELRKQVPGYPSIRHAGEITNWCENEATQLVRSLIARHEEKHAILMREIEQALRQ